LTFLITTLGINQDLDLQGLSLCLSLAKIQTVDTKSHHDVYGERFQEYRKALERYGSKSGGF
jgi:hypothetical protein